MQKLATSVILTLAFAVPAVAHTLKPQHQPGCRTAGCDLRIDRAWGHRHHPPAVAEASWFNDAGPTACGKHLTLGFAHLPAGWPCGTRVRFCHAGRCVIGEREDSGPYVTGRMFDLTPGLKAALGCGDLCSVRWHRLR